MMFMDLFWQGFEYWMIEFYLFCIGVFVSCCVARDSSKKLLNLRNNGKSFDPEIFFGESISDSNSAPNSTPMTIISSITKIS